MLTGVVLRGTVDNADLKPRKDYEDYSKYINEQHNSRR